VKHINFTIDNTIYKQKMLQISFTNNIGKICEKSTSENQVNFLFF